MSSTRAFPQIERVVEGTEPAVSKQYFSQWKEPVDQTGLGRIYTREQIAGIRRFPPSTRSATVARG